jgi:hypothetical protein
VLEWGETQRDAVLRLAALAPLEYDRVREEEARLLGVRIRALDDEVKAARDGRKRPRRGRPEAPEGQAAEGRPQIRVIDGDLHRVVDEAEAALLAANVGVYQRGPMLVRAIRRKALSARTFQREAGSLGLVMIDAPHVAELMTASADFVRWDGRTESWRRVNAPERVAVTYLARIGKWRVPYLRGVSSTPTLRPDGSIHQQPGYDTATGVLFDSAGIIFPLVPDHPSRVDGERALRVLRAPFATFPFPDETDESVALAMLITVVVRQALPAAPVFGITAPVMASGKTLLADAAAIVATGVSAPVMTPPSSEEEGAKLALSVLAQGEPIVLIDNVERPLSGEWLCAAVTAETFTGRLLGQNAMATVPTSTTFVVTGNSLVIAGDLRTRALLCHLDPRCEHPEQRSFPGDLREELLAKRHELVAAALTIIRAFIASETRAEDCVPPWGRFERWSSLVRAPLVWLGCQDPCASLRALEREDPERARHAVVLRAWREAFKGDAVTVRNAIDLALRGGPIGFRDAIEQVARDRSGQLDALRFGRWLQKVAGRIVDGMEFRRHGERSGVAVWCVAQQQ